MKNIISMIALLGVITVTLYGNDGKVIQKWEDVKSWKAYGNTYGYCNILLFKMQDGTEYGISGTYVVEEKK